MNLTTTVSPDRATLLREWIAELKSDAQDARMIEELNRSAAEARKSRSEEILGPEGVAEACARFASILESRIAFLEESV